MEKTLSLIVPVYNEEEVLETSFSRMDAVMKKSVILTKSFM